MPLVISTLMKLVTSKVISEVATSVTAPAERKVSVKKILLLSTLAAGVGALYAFTGVNICEEVDCTSIGLEILSSS